MSYRRRRYEEEREIDREEGFDGERGEEREYERERGEYRREGRYRRERKQEERFVEFVTLGLVLLVFVVAANTTIGAKWIALSGGLIFTVSAFYQSQRRWRVNPLTWIGGISMLVVGLLGIQQGTNDVPGGLLLPVLIFGGVILGSFVTGEL